MQKKVTKNWHLGEALEPLMMDYGFSNGRTSGRWSNWYGVAGEKQSFHKALSGYTKTTSVITYEVT